jgi:hypothetical protein
LDDIKKLIDDKLKDLPKDLPKLDTPTPVVPETSTSTGTVPTLDDIDKLIERRLKEIKSDITTSSTINNQNIDVGGSSLTLVNKNYPLFLGYWKTTDSFGIQGSNSDLIEDFYPTSNVPEPIGNSFSKSYSVAQGRGHKYMAIKRDCIETSGCTENGGEMLSFNQLNHINKVEYSYGLPSIDQKNKLTGCSLEVCKEKFDIEKEIWAVYQLYE